MSLFVKRTIFSIKSLWIIQAILYVKSKLISSKNFPMLSLLLYIPRSSNVSKLIVNHSKVACEIGLSLANSFKKRKRLEIMDFYVFTSEIIYDKVPIVYE